ncbi:MAG: Zn-ribbon domain-containing OB-fold protein [Thaumarchaeota archaeon]|nr:Zn-ribbon domain-containing OB-fold protein [Nitrososphaerota archaeon]
MLSVSDFYSAGRGGKLLGLSCEKGHVSVPPRASCRVCGLQDLHTVELSGRGNVVSFTEVYSKSSEFPLEVPYVLALVSLEEGGNLLGIVEKGAEIRHGSKVLVEFRDLPNSQWPRIFFKLV